MGAAQLPQCSGAQFEREVSRVVCMCVCVYTAVGTAVRRVLLGAQITRLRASVARPALHSSQTVRFERERRKPETFEIYGRNEVQARACQCAHISVRASQAHGRN